MDKKPTPFEALKSAVDIAGGQSALARICKRAQPTVWKWLQSSKRLPAEHVLTVEAATGVSRHVLRPDIYPPETATSSASFIAEPTPMCGSILSALKLNRQGKNRPNLDNAA